MSAAANHDAPHVPVLLNEVIEALQPLENAVVIDATFGAGGYTRALLAAGATVHAFDRDPTAIAAARDWPETSGDTPRLVLHPRRFSEMADAMREAGVRQVDGVVMDIGVSSMQLDQAERGFAFSADGPLDMRMSREGESAADFVNGAEEGAIADVLYQYGEERQSRRVARAIVAARPLETTGALADIVRKALGFNRNDRRANAPKDPATRSFQAIRIHVNAELDELRAGLCAAEDLLREGGRLAVVSFHSLEDRIVKHFLRDASNTGAAPSRHMPATDHVASAVFARPAKPVRPGDAELSRNPRARSAVLRAATRTAAPARPASQRNTA
ncbi:16S rRNA (cytosine(1402)-N(4))-methyltransferase RsmH [Croceicoccus hydrothermalis]|uniref:16S rRNA (cytosine(1402)-N(4))-methyltransferase RsmH n=1 Tax=Croceicoccus hydrothermalis TaxID=2867964 RepID=UPI001EFC234B